MNEAQKDRLQYFGFAAFVGFLLLLNLLDVFKTILGVDTAALLAVLAGYRIFYNAISALLAKKISADLAICIAVIAALAAGEYLAAAEAMFIMLVGEGLESYAAGRTSAAIQRFVEQLPRRARLIKDGLEVEVDAGALVPGDAILVRAGERIGADGVVEQGVSSVDESTITGESLPADKQPGVEVFCGTLNGHGLLRIRVSRAGTETTLARVIRLVGEARGRRAPVERLADRYARYFLPVLLLAAGLTFYSTRDWLRTVAVLIVACPCALILATPTAMVAAIGGLARRGILVRGGAILEQAAKVDTIVLDKTGTVTEGRFEVLRIIAQQGGEDALLRLAAAAEQGSDHMLARVIVDEARRRNLAIPEVLDARVVPGRGAEAACGGRMLRAGNAAFLAEHGVPGAALLAEEADRLGATAVLLADGDTLAGAILLRDRVRAGVKDALAELRRMELTHQVMLTGDRRAVAEVIAREVGVPNVEAELLPEQKLDRVRQFVSQGRVVAMVGDGINDAPALAAAQVGIAVSGAADIAAEAADVVYMGHSLENLPRLFDVSRRAVATAWQNMILFAGVVNLASVWLAASGRIGPLGAALTHQVAALLVMLNSLRLLGARPMRLPSRVPVLRVAIWWRQVRDWASSADPKAAFNAIVARRRELGRPLLAAAAVMLILNGFYILGPDEAGVIERFGRKVSPYRRPGLHYKLPWPIERLTRIQAERVRVVEVGFRSTSAMLSDVEPASYEWNVQHRGGRFQRKLEESLMVTGDQNMIEVNATIHYRLARPEDFLFRQSDGETTVQTAAESVLQSVATTSGLDDILTAGRRGIEARVREELQRRLDRYESGVEVLRVKLLDVHPSLEVVDAFRDVSGAYEEKNRLIDEAEGYRNEQVALARGGASARLENAKGYAAGRRNRAEGDAGRFEQAESAFRSAPGTTETRLYLETMEQVLPGRKKIILDAGKGRRHLFLLDDGVEIGPATAPLIAPQPPIPREERE